MAAWIVWKKNCFIFQSKITVCCLFKDIYFCYKCPSISNSKFFALLHGKVGCIAYILAGI